MIRTWTCTCSCRERGWVFHSIGREVNISLFKWHTVFFCRKLCEEGQEGEEGRGDLLRELCLDLGLSPLRLEPRIQLGVWTGRLSGPWAAGA